MGLPMLSFFIPLFLFHFPSCQDSNPASNDEVPISIRNGTSFGECLGYCWTELYADKNTMTLTRNGWDRTSSLPEQQFSKVIDAETWDKISSLIIFDQINAMEEVYGCPDCADGGAEWIEVTRGEQVKKITFEYGATLEQISELVNAMRSLRESFIQGDGA